MKMQKGFTFTELLIVIVILGILAAFIIPRFSNFDKEAKIGVVKGMAGSIREVSAAAHEKYLASGTAVLNGVTINMAKSGYPAATVDGILAALNQNISGNTIGDFTFATGAIGESKLTLQKIGVTTPCSVSYSEDGNITVDTSGC